MLSKTVFSSRVLLTAAKKFTPRAASRSISIVPMASKQFPKLRLVYFDFAARGEPIRLALHIGGVPFEDFRIQRETWPELKKTMPYGQLPVLEVDGEVVAQSYAILLYAGRLAGLVPEDPLQAAKVEEMLFHLYDLDVLLAPSGKAPDAERKKALREELARGGLATWLASLEKRLEVSASGWIAGDSLTVADLATFGRLTSLMQGSYDHIPADIVQSYPLLTGLCDKIAKHPKVVEWNARTAKQ